MEELNAQQVFNDEAAIANELAQIQQEIRG
jgi:hypothetical protein